MVFVFFIIDFLLSSFEVLIKNRLLRQKAETERPDEDEEEEEKDEGMKMEEAEQRNDIEVKTSVGAKLVRFLTEY